ncbi:hypothetical protein [Chryseobacterium taichungense]|uniref:hypothetical protein n=1 Tax=Chryseobacterium taichungense TaxID=295069 RepID=UPI0028B1E256|nr:hypothetical protein [Chryseobacterium taichungense]
MSKQCLTQPYYAKSQLKFFVIGQVGNILGILVHPDYRFNPEPSAKLAFIKSLVKQ